MLDKFGSQLIEFAPAHLKVMVRNTLPKEMETELLDHPEVDTWEEIIDWCKKKLAYKNQKNLASYLKPGSMKVNALKSEVDDDSEEDVAPRGRVRRADEPPSMSTQVAKLTEMVTALTQGKRPPRSPSPASKTRFVWPGGCHECGDDHFKKDCDKWKKVLSQNGDKMPDGHVNAYSKARDAFNKKMGIKPSAKPKAKAKAGQYQRGGRKHVNSVVEGDVDEDSDFSSDDSEADSQHHCGALRSFARVVKGPKMTCAMTIPVTRTANKFSALKDDKCNGHGDGDECNDVQLMALNQWAHKVQRVSSK